MLIALQLPQTKIPAPKDVKCRAVCFLSAHLLSIAVLLHRREHLQASICISHIVVYNRTQSIGIFPFQDGEK